MMMSILRNLLAHMILMLHFAILTKSGVDKEVGDSDEEIFH